MVEITQKEIYDKLLVIENMLIKTNGRVNLNRWIATTALSLTLIIIAYMVGGNFQ